MEFRFKINGARLIAGDVLCGSSGNVSSYTCRFDIADNESFTWFCVFITGDEAYRQVIENGICVIPSEVLENVGRFCIGCYGTDGNTRVSTNRLEFDIGEGAYCDATMPEEPTPEVWETLVMNSTPYIGGNGNWYVYDKGEKQYKDSGNPSRGEKGDKGDKGDNGADGYTPQRGKDYWTEEDRSSVIDEVESDLSFEESMRFLLDTPEFRKNTFRGKCLGDKVTDEQIAAVRDGSFKDLYIGDYWTINGVNWRIADMDYFVSVGGGKPHQLLLWPDSSLGKGTMCEKGSDMSGGIKNTKMYTELLPKVLEQVQAAFGDVLAKSYYFISASYDKADKTTNGAEAEDYLILPSEMMVLNSHTIGATPNQTIENKQLRLCGLYPDIISIADQYWLSDIVSIGKCGTVANLVRRRPVRSQAIADTDIRHIRPVFAIS